jgi:hypothetical protein
MSTFNSINPHQLGYCDQHPTVDDILMKFANERDIILHLLLERPDVLITKLWSSESPILIDRNCLFRMGSSKNSRQTNYHKFICSQCYNVNRLVDLTRKPFDEPFHLECGKNAGKYFFISKVDTPSLNIQWSPPDIPHYLIDSHFPKMMISSDEFTNGVLINWYLQSQLNTLGFPHILDLHSSFVCGHSGYLLFSHPKIGDITNLFNHPDLFVRPINNSKNDTINQKFDNELYRDLLDIYRQLLGQYNTSLDPDKYQDELSKLIIGIISQLVVTLLLLSKYQFTHGLPTDNVVVFDDTPVAYTYDKHIIKCPVTLKLCNFSRSSITLPGKDIRLHSHTVGGNILSGIQKITPAIEVLRNHTHQKNNYFLSNDVYRIGHYLQNDGIPIFGSSFDFYAILIGLMLNPYFGYTMISNPFLRTFWESIWTPEDLSVHNEKNVIRKLSFAVNSRHFNVHSVLKFSTLRYDVLDHAWTQIIKLSV